MKKKGNTKKLRSVTDKSRLSKTDRMRLRDRIKNENSRNKRLNNRDCRRRRTLRNSSAGRRKKSRKKRREEECCSALNQ